MKNKTQLLEISILTLLLPNAVQANINTWNQLVSGDASGSWNTAANPPWSTGAVPGGADTADLNTLDLTADSTVTLDGNQSINALIFGDTDTGTAAGWTLGNTANVLTLAGTTPTITVNALGADKAATISAGLAGTEGLTKAGAGTLILSGTNTYIGATAVNGGRLSLQDTSKNAFSGDVSIGSGAVLSADTASGNNVHLLSGDLILTGGTLAGNANISDTWYGHFYMDGSQQVIVSGDVQSTIAAEMHLGGTHTFNVADGAAAVDLVVSGKLSHLHNVAWGGIVKTGAGTMHLTSSMDGTNSAGEVGLFGLGGFELQAGTLIFDGSLGYSGSAYNPYELAKFTGPATLKWGVGNTTDISVNSNLRIGAGVTATLDTGANDVTLGTTIVADGAGAAITKTGTGTLTLSATNFYTGPTTVSEGTLALATDYMDSPITVNSEAFLEFAIDSTVTSDSTVTLDSGAKIKISGTPVSPTSYTLINAFGGISGTPILDTAIPGYSLVLESSNTVLKLNYTGGGSNYASWADANGISGEPASGDFDNDGITNLVEYALGKSPTVSTQPAGVLSGNVITYTKGSDAIANGDVSWVIETSQTLAADSWTAVVTQPAADPALTISYTLTPSTPAKRFARLKVTQTP